MDGQKLLKALSRQERQKVLKAYSDDQLEAEIVRRYPELESRVGALAVAREELSVSSSEAGAFPNVWPIL